MSKKHNYTKYYTDESSVTEVTTDIQPNEVEYTPDVAEVEVEVEETTTVTDNTVVVPDTAEGIVVGCTKLNVRSEPSLAATPVCVIDGGDKVTVALNTAPAGWYHVTTAAGIAGWCMSKYVDTCL